MCLSHVDVKVVLQHNAGILNELHKLGVQEENPNAQVHTLPARESQCANARNVGGLEAQRS